MATFLFAPLRGAWKGLLQYPSQWRWKSKSRGPEIWARQASSIWLIELELQPRARARFTIRSCKTHFLSPCFLARTSTIFCPNVVESFARVALFRRREGVHLQTAKTAVFAGTLKIRCFLGRRPLLQIDANSAKLRGLTFFLTVYFKLFGKTSGQILLTSEVSLIKK